MVDKAKRIMKIFISDDDMCTTQKLNLARVHKWFEANNCEITENLDEADKAVCATCNGWSLLEEKSYERFKQLRETINGADLVLLGCVVDSHPAKVTSLHNGPTVRTRSDLPLSFQEIEQVFPEFEVPLADIPAQGYFRRRQDYRDYNPKRLFVNIAEGCAFNCTFCTHKPGLGPRRSRSMADILDQIQAALESDSCDILHLMGMETGLWGIDVGSSYPELLERVLALSESFAIHVAQFQPQGMKMYGNRLVSLLSNKRVVDIQIPIQSTSRRIMKMMNRKEHSSVLAPLLKSIRSNNPRAVLRTDIIVGWPTETDEERLGSLDFACEHFDEIAVYAIELSPDLPAWKYAPNSFDDVTLKQIVDESVDFVEKRGCIAHSGQQNDEAMKAAESKRIKLRKERDLIAYG